METNKSIDWNVNAEEVYEALNDVSRKMSDTLKTKKFYFLNDFYETLGLPRDTNRERAGWCYNYKTGEYELVDDIYNNIHDYDVHNYDIIIESDSVAKQVLSDITGMPANSTMDSLTKKLIFG